MLKRLYWVLICLLLFSLTACAEEKPPNTAATATTETTTQTMLLTTEGVAVTTTQTTLPVTEGIEVTTTAETSTTTTERTTLPEEQRTTVICSLPTTILCTSTTTEAPPATTTRLTGPDTVVTAPQASWDPSTTTTTTTVPATAPTTADAREELKFYVNGETVRLSFAAESTLNGYVTYRYKGVSSAGNSVECTVIPSENKIHEITCDLPTTWGERLTEEEVRDFIIAEFKKEGSDLANAQIDVFVMYNKGNGKLFASFHVFLGSQNRINGTITKYRGRLWFRGFSAWTAFENPSTNYDDTKPFLADFACSYLTPEWV